MLKQVNKLPECTILNTWRTTQMNAKTMKTHLKTFLLHHELKNKECSINDPEWPVVPSVGLVKQTIVFTAFAHHYVFNSCEPSLLQTHRLFSLFIPSGHNLSLNYGKRYQCRMTHFFKNEMIVVWTLIRSLRTKQNPPKKILVCLLCTFPFKSNNCFLFQVIHGTSFAPTCWTSNRDVLCSEPLLAGVKCSLLKAFGCVCSWDFTWRCLQMPLQEAQQEEKRSNPVFSVTHWAYMDHFTNLLDK